MTNDYQEKVLEAVRASNSSSTQEGHWSNLNNIVKAAKNLGIETGFGWNKIGGALRALTNSYQLEHTTFKTTAGFEETWRDSSYTLEILKEVHKTNGVDG